MRLIVVRHGETQWNLLKQTQGMSDIPLTERGKCQAKKLSYRMRNMRICAVLTSPLQRAKETAEILAQFRGWNVCADTLLREICFGDWEGKTFVQIGEQFSDELKIWTDKPQECVIPNGEPLNHVCDRVDEFLRNLQKKYPQSTVVAVTHSVPAKLLIARAIGLPIQNIHALRIDNASMSMIDFYAQRPMLRLFNDVTHLQEGTAWTR